MTQTHIDNAAGTDLLEFERNAALFETLPEDIEQTTEDNIFLTDKQKIISDAILDFATLYGDKWYMAMAGYAGTGKTTVISSTARRILSEDPEKRILFCAPTGKAAQVMKTKLGYLKNCEVGTIHSAIYKLDSKKRTGSREELVWKKKTKTLPYDLIIVDESSMLTESIFKDIISYGIPTVFVGDPGQLPPVEGKPVDILHTTPFVLTEVMRQALENPIIRWATMVRDGKDLPWTNVPWSADEQCIRIRMNSAPGRAMLKGFASDVVSGTAAILCCKNSLRVKLNTHVRAAAGFEGRLPNVGERLMGLKNLRDYGIYNGSTYTVTRVEECVHSSCYMVWLDDRQYPIVSYAGCLHCADSQEFGRRIRSDTADIGICLSEHNPAQQDVALLDYGYASTVHKAQGSEWDNVLFYDDHSQKMTPSEYRRWLYTGITRAKNELCILA